MPRNRVLSFMSQWGGPRSPTTDNPSTFSSTTTTTTTTTTGDKMRPRNIDTNTPPPSGRDSPASPTTQSRARGDSKPPRPMSMLQSYNPPQVEATHDTPPELQPIFSYLNSHSNKLYQEGYFLKLHDLDSRGRPSGDRAWVECFAQLIGTVLSLWDAAALDVAGEDGEVVPTFVNLSDASIKMIESLPMNGAQGGNLQNVLSISTAANNRYLLHFNSLNSLTQWTAGIRLAMFEHTTLQEAYTGSIIAGKGRQLVGIKQIMFRSTFAHEDWARVRFGAGTPWQRCWCVISPPDEKEYAKAQKTLKKSAYEKTRLPKGDIKFYDTRKVTKKTKPIATISDAFAAYAIYPQSKPLIDQSTLVKVEGLVTIHDSKESTAEGFVFVMPEVHAAVTGFEMMLRWLFPVYDTFGLYGRPTKMIADTLDQRGLMFAMPKDRRYGHLDTLDVSGLIHAKGSYNWSERQWRRELKKLTADRMMNGVERPETSRDPSQRRHTLSRSSLPPAPRDGVRFGSGDEYVRSTPGSRSESRERVNGGDGPIPRTDSAPPDAYHSPHKRAASESQSYKRYQTETPSRLSQEASGQPEDRPPPLPPSHGGALGAAAGASSSRSKLQRIQSEPEVPRQSVYDIQAQAASPHLFPPEAVGSPPALTHQANSRPKNTPYPAPELRRAHSNVDAATLYQMQDATRRDNGSDEGAWNGEVQQRHQNTVLASQPYANHDNVEVPADRSQGVVNRKPLDSRQRLSTIPGSPFVGEDSSPQVLQSSAQMAVPQMDGVAEEQERPLPQPPIADAPPVPLHASPSIIRKPVPRPLPQHPSQRSRSMSDATSETDESWAGGYIDEDALNRVLDAPERSNTMQTTTTESTEPDYASTISSHKSPKKSIERPRAGKLKTVGDPDLPTLDTRSGGAGRLDTWEMDHAAQGAEIPDVNFGPTYAYKPSTRRPGSSGTLLPGDMQDKRRSRSADRLSGAFGASPNESHRNSYFAGGDRKTPSPGGRLTPSPGRMTPDPGLSGDRSSMLWQPSGSPGANTQGNRNSVTAEQWVQQRAAMSQQQQQYAAPRTGSGQRNRLTKTPPPGRTLSGDWTKEARRTPSIGNRLTKTPPPGRTLSGDWTQEARKTPPIRPSSRGAGINLDTAGNILTAREQMQVSRATGAPLVNLAGKGSHQHQSEESMLGVMAARERDKAASKEGRNSMAVQQAIERQAMQARMEAEQQYQLQMQQGQRPMHHHSQSQLSIPMSGGGGGGGRPAYQTSNSWYGQQPPSMYGYGGGGQQQQQSVYHMSFAGTPSGYGYSPRQYSPNQQQQQQQQQGYGGYFPPPQQQQAMQSQQWGRR